ncbi:hypothetical protein AAU61_19345 [Desulfocarbo indianensis]|nr:hypothetical protein AAU61_19345 [Desulfocarbo indianensis]
MKTPGQWITVLAALLAGLAGGGLSNWWLGGVASADVQSDLKARSLTIVDQQGRERLYLGVPQGAVVIQAKRADGVKGFGLNLDDKTGPDLMLLDGKGRIGLQLGLDSHGPSLVLYTSEGMQGVAMEVSEGVLPRLGLYATASYKPRIVIRDAGNTVLFRAP